MVLKPERAKRQPPGTDQVLNWAAYGLWEEQQKPHVLSGKEVADKEQLLRAAAEKKCDASAKGKEIRRRYASSTNGEEAKRRYASSTNGTDEAGNKRARVFRESSSRPAVQQEISEPRLGCLGAWLGGS
jgi:hypothetical protein